MKHGQQQVFNFKLILGIPQNRITKAMSIWRSIWLSLSYFNSNYNVEQKTLNVKSKHTRAVFVKLLVTSSVLYASWNILSPSQNIFHLLYKLYVWDKKKWNQRFSLEHFIGLLIFPTPWKHLWFSDVFRG